MTDSALSKAMGNKLKALREDRRWTQDMAAEAMGVSRGQYIKLERGERRLNVEYINRAAKAFGVMPSDILDSDPKMNQLNEFFRGKTEEQKQQALDMLSLLNEATSDQAAMLIRMVRGVLRG
jgi:transcriptional regulator with XRE-family HTH domain